MLREKGGQKKGIQQRGIKIWIYLLEQELKDQNGKNYMNKGKKIWTEWKEYIINEKNQYHSSKIKIGHVQKFTVKYKFTQKCSFLFSFNNWYSNRNQ